MIQKTTYDGTIVSIYKEHKYLLPLFTCPMCDVESYYFNHPLCDSCRYDQCRVCNKGLKQEKYRIMYNPEVPSDLVLAFLCKSCYRRKNKKAPK